MPPAARIVDEQRDGTHARFRVELDDDAVRSETDARLAHLAGRVSVPGFRPGRAPASVLRSHYGRRITDEVVDRMAIAVTRELIEERALAPTGRPVVEIDPQASSCFTLHVDLVPAIDLAAVATLRVRAPEPSDEAAAELARELARRDLFDGLEQAFPIPAPETMVERECARIERGYLEQVGEAPDSALRGELRAIAERRVRLALLIAEIARQQSLQVPRAEVQALVERVAERDPEHETELIDYYLDHPTALAELQSPALEERVVEFLLARCRIERPRMTREELEAALEAP